MGSLDEPGWLEPSRGAETLAARGSCLHRQSGRASRRDPLLSSPLDHHLFPTSFAQVRNPFLLGCVSIDPHGGISPQTSFRSSCANQLQARRGMKDGCRRSNTGLLALRRDTGAVVIALGEAIGDIVRVNGAGDQVVPQGERVPIPFVHKAPKLDAIRQTVLKKAKIFYGPINFGASFRACPFGNVMFL